MKLITLSVPGYGEIVAPSSVPDASNTSVGQIVGWGLNVFIFVGIVASLGFIIFGGFKWITSGGDKQRLDAARKTIIYSIVGLIIMVLSVIAIAFIGSIFGVKYF